MAKILMVVSAADTLTLADGTEQSTGYWAEEVAASHEALTAASFNVDIATPGGREPTVDKLSLSAEGGVGGAEAEQFGKYLSRISDLASPIPLSEIDLASYVAIFLPGGHAPMVDLVSDPDLGRLLSAAKQEDKPVAALCHGVAGLLSAGDGDAWPYAGLRMTGFSDLEEEQGGYGNNIPYSVETVLRDAGGILEIGAPWSNKVVVDRSLITGQNPQSSVSTAQALVAALGR